MAIVTATTGPDESVAGTVAQNSHCHMGLERQQLEKCGQDVKEEQVVEGKEEAEGGVRESQAFDQVW